MKVSLIVAMDKNRVIGLKNDIPWRLPNDWKYVNRITMGHPIVMGRRNFESIGKVLPGRRNIILTKDPTYSCDGAEIVNSIEEVLSICDGEEEIFIFGGEQIYTLFMPFVDKMYITLIYNEFKGDTFFPRVDLADWIEVSVEKGIVDDRNVYQHAFLVYERKRRGMQPKWIEGKWCIEVSTNEFGSVLLLEPNNNIATPVTFNTEEQAVSYINTYQNRSDK